MFRLIALATLLALSVHAAPGGSGREPKDYDALKRRAEELYAEGSFELARRAYEEATREARGEAEERWVAFRLADCAWRQAAASKDPDRDALEEPRARLVALLELWKRPEERDFTWAQVHESLGDWSWTRRDARDFGRAGVHYRQALEHYAASSDVEAARARYLGIVRRAVRPEVGARGRMQLHHGQLGLDVLESAARIAVDPLDRAFAHYVLGLQLSQLGDPRSHRRVRETFEAVLAYGRESEWYDHALYALATWTEGRGTMRHDPERGSFTEPDFAGALSLYRRFLDEYSEGESAHWRDVVRRVEEITGPQLSLTVGQAFLPGSIQRFHLRWRNVAAVELTLHAVDLARDVELGSGASHAGAWLEAIPLERLASVRRWRHETGDEGRHARGEAELEIEPRLAPGAYVLSAAAGGQRARELVLVSDAALVLKAWPGSAVLWFAGVHAGAPIEGARVRLFERVDPRSPWRSLSGSTDAEGLARFALSDPSRRRELFAAAVIEGRQAFALVHGGSSRSDARGWKLYAHSDRAAYRPGQTVHWKLVARERVGGLLATPAGKALRYELVDPRGQVAADGALELGPFGSAFGSFEPGESWTLGEYRLRFLLPPEKDERSVIGESILFRLEEYKLPEFRVTVELPKDEEGRARTFRLGELVEASVAAEYYFGGPVGEASVELLVYQRPFFQHWEPPREFPWFYEDAGAAQVRRWWGPGELVQRELLRTDASGRARLSIQTPAGTRQDLEYTIEARVTDASRREVSGTGAVRVTRQSYAVYPRLEHELHRPGGTATVLFHAQDANGSPVRASGEAALLRRRWRELWIDPLGRVVEGAELERVRREAAVFPPQVPGGRGPWTLRQQRYEEELVARTALETDEEGSAAWNVRVPREGYYLVRWSSADEDGTPILAEASFFVADEGTSEIGYKSEGLRIVLDRDTFRAGSPGHVMLALPASGRHVLFAVETEELVLLRVVHVKGTVALVELDVDARWVPNARLVAHGFSDGRGLADSVEVIVPPEEHFLEVELALDPQELLPGAPGRVQVVTRDREGRPVSAEVSLALVDEALAAIQGDYAGDPRQFFFGQKRAHGVASATSEGSLRYAMLVERTEHGWRDAREVRVEGPEGEEKFARGPGEWGVYEDGDVSLGRLEARREVLDDLQLGARARGRDLPQPAAAQAEDARAGLAADEAPPEGALRSDFRETALWQPSVVTDAQGRASVELVYPDSLTDWRAVARAATEGARFGIGRGASHTRKPLVARLQLPRFLVAGDDATVSLNLDNRTGEPVTVRPTFSVEGLELLGYIAGAELAPRAPEEVRVPAGGGIRLDWRVRATEAGEARFVAGASGAEVADAVERRIPVVPHGIEVLEARAGRSEAEEVLVALELPAERAEGTTRFTVQVTPSLAVTMLDALPYLVDYPYGCTEQTLSRFLPAVIVKRTLEELGLAPEDAMQRVFGGIEREGAARAGREAKVSLHALDALVRAGLERLYSHQHADGGWGWWKEGDTDLFMTGYVVWGLALARDAGVDVRADVLAAGARRLALLLVEAEHRPDLAVWMLHALTAQLGEERGGEDAQRAERAFAKSYAARGALNAYGRALLALSAVRLAKLDEAGVLARNLIDGAILDRAPDASIVQRGGAQGGTAHPRAHWGEDGIYHRWSEGGVEATAFALRALLAVDPAHELVEPAAQWLLANRRGAQWSNTRDTAIVVLAFDEYLRKKGELDRTVEYEVAVNGEGIARRRLAPGDMLAAPASFEVPEALLRAGRNEVAIRRLEGEGPLYFAVHARFTTLEEPILPRGSELFLRRQYFRLAPRPTLLRGTVYERVPLEDGGLVVSGERVEVVLTVETKTHLEYLVFEDLKPAGLEATAVKSGERIQARELTRAEARHRFGDGTLDRPGMGARVPGRPEGQGYTGRALALHQELRDRKVALFADRLPEGVWELRYDLRAEVPGSFHALPLLGHAMYVPEIRANGAELRLGVQDREPGGE